MKHARVLCLLVVMATLAVQAADLPAAPARQTVEDAYPGLVSGMLAVAALGSAPEGVLIQADGFQYTARQLDDVLANSPANVRAQLRKNAAYLLDEAVTRKLLFVIAKEAAEKSGKDIGRKPETEVVNEYLDGVATDVTVTDDEVTRFYEENTEMFGGAKLRSIRKRLTEFVRERKRREAWDQHLQQLAATRHLVVSAPWVKEHAALARDNPADQARASGLPSMVDFGADGCIPCEKMRPILAALKEKYAGRVNIVFVHARQETVLAMRYRIRSIPTQIFYDKAGKEVFRHTGYFSQRDIESKLHEMGVQ